MTDAQTTESQIETAQTLWQVIESLTCPGYRICKHWTAGGGCCGATARQKVEDWKRDNG